MPAKKQTAARAYSIDDLLQEGIRYTPEEVPEAAPAPVEPTGFARTQGDRALALGQGVVGGVKMLSDLAGPDNAVSQTLGKANEGMQGLYSPARAAEMKNRQSLIEEADASGSTMNQITSRLGGIAEAPLQTTLQAAGSMAPNIAAAIATGGVSAGPSLLATAARIGVPAALGVGMGVGSVKGQNYEAVLQKAKQEGMTDEQAQALAVQASEYSTQNAPQQAFGGALGALDSMTGAERIISGMARKGVTTAPANGMVRRIGSGGIEEAIPEGAQGAQGQYAQNEAMNNAGFTVDPWAGVAGQGVNDAVVGAMIGGPAGAMNGNRKVPEVGPLSRGANAGIDAAPPPPVAPAPVVMTPEQEQTLLAHANARAQQLTDKANGTKDVKTTAPDGTPVTLPGQVKQFLTPVEKDEAAFLQEHGGDAQELVHTYPGLLAQPEVAILPHDTAPTLAETPAESIVTPPASAAELPQPTAEAFTQREQDRPAAPMGKVQDGDILNGIGKPYTNMQAAMTAQRKAGDTHEIVRVAKGLVVRAKEANGTTAATPGLDTGAAAGADHQSAGSRADPLVQPVPGTDGAGNVPAAPDGRSQADNVVVDASAGAASVKQENQPKSPASPAQSATENIALATPSTGNIATPKAEAPSENAEWTRMPHAERLALTTRTGMVKLVADKISRTAWADITPKTRARIEAAMAAPVSQPQEKPLEPTPLIAQQAAQEGPKTPEPSTAGIDTPELVKIKTLDGLNTYVRKADLEGDAKLIRMFTATGKRNGRIHRENLDPTGAKQAANNAENADNPHFDVITTKDGKAFTTKTSAQRELKTRALTDSHEVAPASEVSQGAAGFVVRRKAAQELNAKTADAVAMPAQEAPLHQDSGAAPEVATVPVVPGLAPTSKEDTPVQAESPTPVSKSETFIKAPDGSTDFGEITDDMAKSMKRQSGKIRLQHGNKEFGLTHIESRHGKQIHKIGFTDTAAFVADALGKIDAVWKPDTTTQMVVIQSEENGRAVFIQLMPGKDESGDFYTVNTAFPTGDGYAENKKGWKTLWSRVPVPADDTGKSSLFASPADKAGQQGTVDSSQSEAQIIDEPVKNVKSELKPSQASIQPATKPAGKIEDSGAVLEGARKLYAKAYAAKLDEGMGMDTAAVPLSKSWPEPDYQRMLDDGADPWAVAMARALRDEIPNKPSQLAWKVKGWVKTVESMRDMAAKVMSGELTQEKFKTTGGQFNLTDWFNKIDLYEAVGHANSLKGVTFSKGEYGMYGGQTFSPAKTLWSITEPSKSASATWSHGNWGNELAVADTKAEAISKYQAYLASQGDKAPTATKATAFDIYSYGKVPGFIVGKRLSSTKSIDLKTFTTIKEARAYKAGNQAELEKLLEAAKVELPERRDTNAPRIGTDHRNGSDVTTEQFRDSFGFRGEQFGASMPQGERQSNLNQAYDALMDLAGIIGIPPKALSLNGELGLAFGARGTGGVHAAAAHYERDTTGAVTPNRVVINLTRKNGAGSLAHEFFHAVDNYFARMRGEKAGMLTDNPNVANDGVRPEIVAAFRKLKTTIAMTGLQERSRQLDKKRVKDYWSTGPEMAARSFESYVIAKLQDQSASNDYLANIVTEELYGMQAAYPYPSMGEMPQIRAAFDHFFDTIQTKDTDQGVALFSRAEPTTGLPTTQVQSIVDRVAARWANAPEIVVATSMSDQAIPQAVRDHDQKQKSLGATGEPEGFVYGGKVYLLAGQITSPGDVVQVLLHEALGHIGLRGAFDGKLVPILKQIAVLRKAEVSAKARQYGLDMSIEADRIQAAEEVLAELSQSHPELGYVKRAIAAIRNWLRANVPGFSSMKLTDADIIEKYILPARNHVENGGKTGNISTHPAFSRSTLAIYTQHATDKLNETFSHPGKLSLWDKTVGSMYHLAERSPPFKRVFDAAQSFIQDVSYYATEAADMAPKILPKLDTWKDMLKTPVSAADNKAISTPILQGTLSWARDEDGKPVRMEELDASYENLSDEDKAQMLLKKRYITPEELKRWKASPIDVYAGAVKTRFEVHFLTAGVVWKDAELQSMFNLNPAQIGLYHEFRAATDQSLDNLAKADLLRFGGKDIEHLKDIVMESDTVDEAAFMLRDYLHSQRDLMPERVDDLTAAAGGMIERADKVAKLKKQGYAPLSRFGRYSVDVVVGGERQYFSLFESARAANLMAVKLKSEYGAANVAQGTMSQKEFEMFQGITPESLELFGNMLGLDSKGNEEQDKAFQTYLKLTKTNRSAMKRMIHRKGTEGFSEDMGRVLAAFVYSNARQTSAALHMGELGDSVQAIPKGQGELKDAALELSDYIKKPREEAQALRGLLFAQYLGGSVASAFVNFTQPLTVSFPYLSQYGGATKAGAALIQAMKDQRAGKVLEAGLKEALHQAEEEGTVSPQSVHELMAQAQGRAALNSGDGTKTGDALAQVQNNFSKLALGWGKLFGWAEQVNRRSTYIAAYRIAVEQKMADPNAFAIKAVHETQFISNKANKAKFARGAIGATLMTFKSYSTNYLELLHRMATRNGPEGKKAAALMLGMLFLMAGAGGLPFAEDLEDMADFFAQRLGYNFSSKKAKQEFLEGLFDKGMADFIDKGISGLPGSPVDTSGRMSMGNLIPGTGLLLKKRDHTGDVQELFGPAGDLMKRTFQAGDKAASGDLIGAAKAIAPKAVYNALKGKDMAMTGTYNDDRGFKVIETTPFEAAMKAIGFQPESVADVQQANYLHQRAKDFYSQNAQEINAKWAKGLYEKDPAQVDDARAMVKNWNELNPDQRITANMPAILKRVKEMRKSKDQRIADTAPKSMRAEMRRETAQARADAM